MIRWAPWAARIAARYFSGISRSVLITIRLRLRHRMSVPVWPAASTSQRDVIHVHGQAGSKKNSIEGECSRADLHT